MNDRDCESCKKFSRNDPHESEGYCQVKRSWVDPQEGEDCKMHEFTLHSATKYKDGTPIMSEPEKVYCDTDNEKSSCYDCKYADWDADGCTCKLNECIVRQPREGCPMHEFTLHSATKYKDGTPIMSEPEKVYCESDAVLIHGMADSSSRVDVDSSYSKLSNQLDYLERAFKGFAKTQDELIEEYDATLKIHGDTLEDHHERITMNEGNIDSISSDVEDLQRKVAIIYQFINSVAPGTFFKVMEEFKRVEKENIHNGSDFCGNCAHCDHGKQGDDTIYICTLSHGFVDPDDSSCSHFEPPF